MGRRIVVAPVKHGYHVSYKQRRWIFAKTFHVGVFSTFDEASAKVLELVDGKISRDFKIERL